MKTQVTASAFWTLFESDLQHNKTMPIEEALRHSAILGFTAIDAAINTYWQEVIVADWGEHMSLVNIVLDDDEEMDKLHSATKSFIKKSQLVATLRFISHTGDIEKFSPNFLDLATICVLANQSPANLELASLLATLQQHRNQALHTGREWSELTAHKCIKNIKACSDHLNKLHFCFTDIFGASALYQAGVSTKKVA